MRSDSIRRFAGKARRREIKINKFYGDLKLCATLSAVNQRIFRGRLNHQCLCSFRCLTFTVQLWRVNDAVKYCSYDSICTLIEPANEVSTTICVSASQLFTEISFDMSQRFIPEETWKSRIRGSLIDTARMHWVRKANLSLERLLVLNWIKYCSMDGLEWKKLAR